MPSQATLFEDETRIASTGITWGNPMDTNLVTNLVLLATAVVGFYTAIVSIRRGEQKEGDGISVAVETAIGTLLSVLPVLIFPAALLGFMFLINTYTQYSMNMVRNEQRYVFPDASSETEQMYLLSTHFWDQGQRQEVLHMVIDKALEVRDYEIVLRAAKDLNPTDQTDGVLLRAIQQIRGPIEAPPSAE